MIVGTIGDDDVPRRGRGIYDSGGRRNVEMQIVEEEDREDGRESRDQREDRMRRIEE